MQIRNVKWMLLFGAAIGLALGGCDDDDDEDAVDAGRRDAGVVRDAAPDARPDAGMPAMTIAELATATPELSVLVSAVTRADMAEALAGAGPLTVFAPTNQAFAEAGITQAMIDAMPVADLQRLLGYHVIEQELTVEELRAIDRRFVETMSENPWGLPMAVVIEGADVVTVNDLDLVQTNIEASNGIVHVIDGVLVPPTVLQMADLAGLSQLIAAVGVASPITPDQTIEQALSGPGPFTLFAPNDAAFVEAQPLLSTLNEDEVRGVLLYHVLDPASYDEPVEVGDFPTETGARVQTLLGPPAAVNANVEPPTVLDATIVEQDVHVVNGTLHIIDGVLLPIGIAP
jgi:uncharacterized surface protein with fasciclin (FAS1) repeats